MIIRSVRRKWNFKKLAFLFNILYFLIVFFAEIPENLIYNSGFYIALLNSVILFNRIKKTRLAEILVNVFIINTVIWFILVNLVYTEKPSEIFNFIAFVLVFISLTSIITFIFSLIYKIILTKKYQLVFNVVVLFFMIVVSIILYKSNIVNKQILEISVDRLQLLESKFGGEKNLRCSESNTIKKVRESVVRIIGGEAEGSGFIVSDDGLILTNFHVIEFEPAPRVMFPDYSIELAKIIYGDKNADLAVLKVTKKIPAIDWGNSDEVEPAEEMLSFGFPFGGSLGGEATVKKGYLSAKRNIQDQGVEFMQTDSTINPGMSGGPMTTVCGEFIGINTLGTAGIGMAISSNSFKNKYFEMKSSNEPLKDIIKVEFKPDESPVEAVKAFYNYIKIRKLDKAFELLQGGEFNKDMTFENWKKGYESNLDTSVLKVEEDPENENKVNIRLSTKDLINDQIVYKFFEGWWEVKKVEDHLKLWQPKIREVEDPSWLWFYE
ncbi:hypothetical protein A2774_05170 [Candidatus Roizmanbacteria bacterium RIFCSPHIGHO2_01_FULL_39_12c]|uniref:Serine protease n=1 Tax=Candidatus Roizmanbacteria bacterium RIFCSPHIGHO2_01_FULL_39_12c TaxID=1802031 RepID=A0A1F7GBS7_9BACT|nr:MAG: hypothetical protein A2774_05170 [Candidatus Roizmanbacteria bacterium RIFCSPHIGHO2_01_FULL_39_12c]OGK47917.1 MAG: hypothetical protein A2963_03640 [Candidatus Roizmanbacteria bacterium RIFCSPLOWO2_01_FULL_40_13]